MKSTHVASLSIFVYKGNTSVYGMLLMHLIPQDQRSWLIEEEKHILDRVNVVDLVGSIRQKEGIQLELDFDTVHTRVDGDVGVVSRPRDRWVAFNRTTSRSGLSPSQKQQAAALAYQLLHRRGAVATFSRK